MDQVQTIFSRLVFWSFSAKDKRTLASAVGSAVTMVLLSTALIMTVGIPMTGPLLRIIDTPADIFDMGDSGYPLVFLLVATISNIFLDILFVSRFHMSIADAAWATILAQFASAVLCVLRLYRMRDKIDLRVSDLRPQVDLTKHLMRLCLPTGLTQAIFSLAMVFVQERVAHARGLGAASPTSALYG